MVILPCKCIKAVSVYFHLSKHICLLALHGSTDIVVDTSALGVKYSIYWS